jgi:hypothetical protein
MATYHVNVQQTGAQSTSVVGDHARVLSNFGPGSSAQDLLTLLEAIRAELDQMDLPADVRDEARLEVERAMLQAKREEPDKHKLVESLKNAADVVKRASSIALGVAKFWTLVRKAIEWAS